MSAMRTTGMGGQESWKTDFAMGLGCVKEDGTNED
ncbi:hypothetical protein EVA_01917 [gut metagenome]|uniref:Uncharacterized protein n=1 Tax=gut metagenome TaxID=749906 RepID=J9DAP6_9ZZZZ